MIRRWGAAREARRTPAPFLNPLPATRGGGRGWGKEGYLPEPRCGEEVGGGA